MFSVNVVVSLVNVLFFVVVQTIFFKLVGAQQLDRTVQEKAKVLRVIRENLEENELRTPILLLDAAVLRTGVTKRDQANREKEKRKDMNNDLIVRWMGPLALFLIGAIILVLVYNRKHQRPLTFAHYVGLVLVVVSYVTELMFFFFVVRKYVIVGDYELLNMYAS